MEIDLSDRQWDAVLYALDLWLDMESGTRLEMIGFNAQEKIWEARAKAKGK